MLNRGRRRDRLDRPVGRPRQDGHVVAILEPGGSQAATEKAGPTGDDNVHQAARRSNATWPSPPSIAEAITIVFIAGSLRATLA